jgi:hypothetical protein
MQWVLKERSALRKWKVERKGRESEAGEREPRAG